MTPLLLTAVAVALPARLGLINVGGEGQLYIGAWAASAARSCSRGLPAWILLPLVARRSASRAARCGPRSPGSCEPPGCVSETISTLLLNYVAPLIVSYFVFGPWRSAESSDYPQSASFPERARLPSFFDDAGPRGTPLALAGAPVLLAARGEDALGRRDAGDRRQRRGGASPGHPGGALDRHRAVPSAAAWPGWRGWARSWRSTAGCARASRRATASRASSSPGWPAEGRSAILLMAFLFAVITSAGDILQMTQAPAVLGGEHPHGRDPLRRAGQRPAERARDEHPAASWASWQAPSSRARRSCTPPWAR